ncbi:MAG TPA: sensor domain-containing protein [Trebonia sp.]|nr:sensor domain-containing protein [Trebonia sp.]
MDGIRRVVSGVVRAPFTRRAWRELLYCTAGAIAGVAGFFLVLFTLAPALFISASVLGTVVGLLIIVAVLIMARRLGALHRLLLRRCIGYRVTAPAPFQRGEGVLGRLDRRLRDRDGWRAVGYAELKLPVAIIQGWAVVAVGMGLADISYPLVWLLFRHRPAGTRLGPLIAVTPVPDIQVAIDTLPGTLLAVVLGAASVLAGVWLARAIVIADRRLARALLGPSRVSELERTRAIAVEDAAAALRRVERDLHDGAQVRLAAVAMNVGMAQDKTGDAAVRELLDAAQAGLSEALADLRRIARGIHPPVLDTGLADALESLAASSPIPATVRADVARRPSPAIETIGYFCVAELLANAIKHSSANRIEINIDTYKPDVLRLRVGDDGRGGADPSRGTGLAGLAQRVSTVDGSMSVSSPAGGPTSVTVELPIRMTGRGA